MQCLFQTDMLSDCYCALFMNHCVDDWRSRVDQYRWRGNCIVKLPRNKPVLRKCYFVSETLEGLNSSFKKIAIDCMAINIKPSIHW